MQKQTLEHCTLVPDGLLKLGKLPREHIITTGPIPGKTTWHGQKDFYSLSSRKKQWLGVDFMLWMANGTLWAARSHLLAAHSGESRAEGCVLGWQARGRLGQAASGLLPGQDMGAWLMLPLLFLWFAWSLQP